ncbi:MAG: AAA family ATPase [Streptosporangiales bacterium]|nr:AAA family ATPase [Streptosporangiales bacterium]
MQRAIDRVPMPRRIAPVIGAVAVLCPVLAPAAVAGRARSRMATAYVAMLALWIIAFFVLLPDNAHPGPRSAGPLGTLLLLPLVMAVCAHLGPLRRAYVPCRTAAMTLVWPVVLAVALGRDWSPESPAALMIVIGAWVLAFIALGWRMAKRMQDPRLYETRARREGQSARSVPDDAPENAQPAEAAGTPGARAGAGQVAARAADAAPGQGNRAASRQAAPASRPEISVEDAMAELDAMIGLAPVKEQVRSIAASIEAARRRAVAGYSSEKPMRHFVFLGPPGTGKTTVARVVGKIFYAFGLLEVPDVVEAQRSDLVGEYLGATAIKTNELVDRALGRVLFIDEAYSLVNEGDGQADRFGIEAVQSLLKRAEDDRENLIIILAGYEKQTEAFLSTNPGLASRFATRIRFPSYSPDELMSLADLQVTGRGEMLGTDARPVLRQMLDEVGRRRMTDELGNGRFVRTLMEKSGQARDVRVMGTVGDPTAEDLITISGPDVSKAFGELTSRLRGYEDTPTLESALAELDELIGLDPVKQQVHAIAAQLRVAKLRDTHGLASQPPARHFVFTGPPGTGKTTVARILGRIFAALGLLVRPEVIEAHRADLVGEHLGSTAIKTNKLIDSALGGVLFIDEAYSLHNAGYTGGDPYGDEAIATLLKRAEDDRDRLVVVLAGYPADMDRFLRSNQGLGSRFSSKVSFPSYTAADLLRISTLLAEQAGDVFDAGAEEELSSIFSSAVDAGRVDDLGNGRFARSLFERACACRDVRVVRLGESATAEDLTTLTADDVRGAYADLVVLAALRESGSWILAGTSGSTGAERSPTSWRAAPTGR